MKFIKNTLVTILLVITLIFGLCVGFVFGRYSLPKIKIVDAKKLLGVMDNEIISNWPMNNNKQMASFVKLNSFSLFSPYLDDNDSIVAMKENMYVGLYQGTNDIAHKDKDGHYYNVTEWDIDRKGVYDAVLYNTFDNTGHVAGMVIDLDRDGQPDIKVIISYDNNGKSIVKEQYNLINGKWYKREKINGKSLVKDGVKYRTVKKDGRKFVFLD